jgi:transcriptional regulator with XRE-family HTH domain
MLFHEKLRSMRLEKYPKLLPFAEKAGYTRPTIRGYESGKTPPPAPDVIRNICRTLNASDETCKEMVELAYETHVHLQAINYYSFEELITLK